MSRQKAAKGGSTQQKSDRRQKRAKSAEGGVEREENGGGEDMKGRTEREGRDPWKRQDRNAQTDIESLREPTRQRNDASQLLPSLKGCQGGLRSE